MRHQKFKAGLVVATPGCLAALAESEQTAREFLDRHLTGDWGDVDAEDATLNDRSVQDGSRILSAYMLRSGTRIWIVSEAVGDDCKRASTTLLLPEEY